MSIDEKTVESHVVSHYLTSGDYNGLPLSRLASDLGADRRRLLEVVVPLVRAGRVSLPSPYQTNPHVKLFDVPVEEQLLRVDERELWLLCLYPTPSSVSKAIDPSKYDDRPFTKLMVLAYPKGLWVPFRLNVLDLYQRDPRYEFRFNGFSGSIEMLDEYRDQLEESDKITVRFGLGYDDQGDRLVVVYLYRLDRLPGEQQRIWKDHLFNREFQVSKDYVTATIEVDPKIRTGG